MNKVMQNEKENVKQIHTNKEMANKKELGQLTL